MDNDSKEWRRPPASKLEDEIRQHVQDRVRENLGTDRLRLPRRCGKSYGGLIPGIILLAIGSIFLLDNLGYVSAGRFFAFWPLIPIAIGVAKIVKPESRFWGAMFVIFGIFLLLNQLGVAHFGWGQLWPLLLICAGVSAMWSGLQARRMMDQAAQQASDPRTTLNENAIFAGVEKRLNTKEFRGGQMQAVFAGIEVDLRDADIAENEAVIYVNAIFGGIELRVPDTWFVAARGQGVFGGFSDSTRYSGPSDSDKPKKTLIVHGTALFGGVEIRN